jgi:DNA polymerase III epsilon subunit-like protein
MSKINSKDYVVLDVETNGLSSLKHDLLSISIYKPDDNKIYDRFLPLELNDFVETYWINGIDEDMLSDKTPLTQEEFDELINDFELDRRTILTYGSIDEKFIKNYLKRKKISGFEKLTFYNFKHDIISSKFSEGNITKDNLCNIYGIDGTIEVHSGLNDCILEWKLFEKMNGNKLIIISNTVNEFNDEYMIPASYLQTYPNFKYSIKNYPKINYELIPVKSFNIKSKELEKFDTNISGMTIEHLINTMLEARDVNDETLLFQAKNRSKLKMIGKLPSMIHNISAIFNKDGTITAVNKDDEERVKKINEVTLAIKKEISPLIEFIKNEIFNNEEILSQELVLNENDNVMAKCDLSSDNKILEIKAFNDNDIDKFKYQLYYEANGRDIYLLQTFWFANIKKGLKFTIYKVNPIEYKERTSYLEVRKSNYEKKINNKDISVLTYNGYGQKVLLKCSKCNNEWESSYNSILRYNQCPFCNPKEKKNREKIIIPRMTEEEKIRKKFSSYQYKIALKSNSTIQVLEYTGSREPVKVKCLVCGLERTYSRADHFLDRCGCSNCKNNNT